MAKAAGDLSLKPSAGLLCYGKSCRLHWINYLHPDLKRDKFTHEEDDLIIKLHGLIGNKWSVIAARLPGRTDNEIKNYRNTHIKRKLVKRGVDPITHRLLIINHHQPPKNDDDQQKENNKNDKEIMSIIGFGSEETRERCPDLNLELRISPPHNDELVAPLCFACSLGLPDCICTTSNFGTTNSTHY